MHFKEKRLLQAEAVKKYAMCEQLSVEIKELKDKKRELELEKQQFIKKGKRAIRRQTKKSQDGSESSDIDEDGASSISERSRSTTPAKVFQLRSLSSPSSFEGVSAQTSQTPTTSEHLQSPPPPVVDESITPISSPTDSHF